MLASIRTGVFVCSRETVDISMLRPTKKNLIMCPILLVDFFIFFLLRVSLEHFLDGLWENLRVELKVRRGSGSPRDSRVALGFGVLALWMWYIHKSHCGQGFAATRMDLGVPALLRSAVGSFGRRISACIIDEVWCWVSVGEETIRCNVMACCDRREPSLSHTAEVANCCAVCARVHHGDPNLDLLQFLFGYCCANTYNLCNTIVESKYWSISHDLPYFTYGGSFLFINRHYGFTVRHSVWLDHYLTIKIPIRLSVYVLLHVLIRFLTPVVLFGFVYQNIPQARPFTLARNHTTATSISQRRANTE